jgi:hypothetical protein
MTDAELDGLLLLAFHPKKRERLNLSDKELFSQIILSEIAQKDLEEEFGENLIFFTQTTPVSLQSAHPKKELTPGILAFRIFTMDMKIVKMSALKTFDESKEITK